MFVRKSTLLAVAILFFSGVPSLADVPGITVLYPKENSIVGGRVNVVLDPGTDWSAVPFFQVSAGGVEYPPVDTSTGKHAFQGVELSPGLNTISVRALAPAAEKETKDKKTAMRVTASVQRQVFSMVEIVTGRRAPAGYEKFLFHSRENETVCSGCHALEIQANAPQPKKPEDAICHACHRGIPSNEHIHGPAAVWNCTGCHDPEIYPVKYQFTAEDPWRVTKTVQPVEPVVVTIPNEALFRPGSSYIPGVAPAKNKKDEAAKKAALEKHRELFKEVLEHIKLNPGDRLRIESHTDDTPLPKPAGKNAKGYKDNLALTRARAATVASLLKQLLNGKKRVIAAGMGDALPKAPNTTPEGREKNNRIEIVLYPADVKVVNSSKLPILKDRQRIIVTLSYTKGPEVRKLKLLENLPRNTQYLKGTGFFLGKNIEPKVKGGELSWDLGDMGHTFTDTFSYVIKHEKKVEPVAETVTVSYATYADKRVTRQFDPKMTSRKSHTVQETCSKCHPDMLSGPSKHGPTDAGLCTLCHDPHASPNSAQLRKPRWSLCTTCHDEKATEVHVLAGYGKRKTHPTHGKHDPARYGKRFSCTSCHNPHSALTKDLYQFEVRGRNELCSKCHKKG